MKLYHETIYMPKKLIEQCSDLYCGNLEETEHFLKRSRGITDKYVFNPNRFHEVINEIKATKPKPFEIETTDSGEVTKCCIRMPFDDYRDVCVVFRKNRIITFWFNNVSDNHLTLDTSRYCYN